MSTHNDIIIFTDLDGSFLDHQSYDYAEALPALERLHDLGIKVIPTTSKTLAELDDLKLPFESKLSIAENGMVISDGGDPVVLKKSYVEIIGFIDSLPDQIRSHINGFHDMDVEGIMHHTSLPQKNAALAKTRLGSEPFLWSGGDAEMKILEKIAANDGYCVTQGGRFYHLMSAGGGKEQAIKRLVDMQPHSDNALITIALGDGPNDADMLSVVDYGVKIPNAHGHHLSINNPKGEIIDASFEGPKGWNQSIHALLDRLFL